MQGTTITLKCLLVTSIQIPKDPIDVGAQMQGIGVDLKKFHLRSLWE